MTKAPCIDCEKRHPACHDNCTDYKTWLDKVHARKRKPNPVSRSKTTERLWTKHKNATYKGKEYRWMKDKH